MNTSRHAWLRHSVMALTFSPAVFLAGCKSSNDVQDTSAEEAKIRQLDADRVKAAATHSPDAWMAFYTDDAVVMPPNEPTASDKASIRKSLAAFFSTPGLVVTWIPTKVEVSDSEDIAYVYGTYKMSARDEQGKAFTELGKNVEIWQSQEDGSWKCAVDIWNSDLPLPAATR